MSIQQGDIVEGYPYLWLRQFQAGETEGRKPRPVCVAVVAKGKSCNTHLALLPISSQKPAAGQAAVLLLPAERRRIGLDGDRPAWVYANEYNYDILEASYYFPQSPGTRKRLSTVSLKRVLEAFRPTLQKRSGQVTR